MGISGLDSLSEDAYAYARCRLLSAFSRHDKQTQLLVVPLTNSAGFRFLQFYSAQISEPAQLSCLATGPRDIYETVGPPLGLARRLLPVIHFFSRVLVFEEGRCVQERLSAIEYMTCFYT